MPNITREYYKKAIREKYEKEKNGDNSYYLEVPSQAKLRDLCWKIFVLNDRKDDLNIFSLFFKSEFDPTKETAFNQYVDKFRSIGSFLKGKKEPANFYAVELASILVDFELRPYSKFRKYYVAEENITEKVDDLILVDLKKEQNGENENTLEEENKGLKEVESSDESIKPLNLFVDFKKELPQKENVKTKRNILILTGIICLLFLVYYFAQQKQCMQWSGNHYEEVNCDLKIQEIGTYNVAEPLDERIINLRKIQVCDTTTFFKNGEAVIWYVKVGDSVEFFNTHGRHPENKKPLRPVTQYIIDKYLLKNKKE